MLGSADLVEELAAGADKIVKVKTFSEFMKYYIS
jgi:hypothetical protein